MKHIFPLFYFTLAAMSVFAGSARRTPVVTAVEKALPSVVNIATEQVVRVSDPFESFFNDYFSRPAARYYKRSIPLGSGVVIDSRGLVITNYHVVRRASNIDLRFLDKETVKARLVAHDAGNDLALLQFFPDEKSIPVKAVPVARPDDVYLGETVVAVGNPFGLGHSVTTGVLSAVDRRIEEGDIVFDDILQTDAAINPGNSGGPLINLDGELIGLNLAIRRDAEGIGFALPVARIVDVVSKWLIPAHFSNGFLGMLTHTRVDGDQPFVEVEKVLPDSPAEAGGITSGDVIRRVNDQPLTNSLQLGRALWRLKPGDTVKLIVNDGRETSLTVAPLTDEPLVTQRLGIRVQTLTPALREAMGLPQGIKGVAISELDDNSALAAFGIGRGDVIMGVNRVPVTRFSDLVNILKDSSAGDAVHLEVLVTRPLYGELLIRSVSVRVPLQ
ncbi:MAG: trypsin-like peptidase domain-containing protein [Lentisphaeria bacterium]|nr:trypsin-like peptidase domain-containing protein [Lentisphaeria bacterium]